MKKKAFSLIEIMIVVAILAVLALIAIFSVIRDKQKAEDSLVKTDLSRLKIAFEDYYNDHNCYPPVDWFDGPEDCGSHVLSPYLQALVCDIHTQKPYLVENDSTGCGWFKITGTLHNAEPYPGCLSDSCPTSTTYRVSSGNINPYPDYDPNAVPSPTPSPNPDPSDYQYLYYCQALNNCTSYNRVRFNCTPSFTDSYCSGTCATTIGSCTDR
ncbi:MAG: prepilin-type N-terminal cleavage/methylation domain-containing protein [bacterium]